MLVRKRQTQILSYLSIVLLSTHCCFANELNRLQDIRSNINKGISLYNEDHKKEALILYSNEDFTDILNVSSWAAAIYDGKPWFYITIFF